MNNELLLTYIRQSRLDGISDDVIKNTLASSGWNQVDIEAGFSQLSLAASTTTSQSPFEPTATSGGNISPVALADNTSEDTPMPMEVTLFKRYMYLSVALGIVYSAIALFTQKAQFSAQVSMSIFSIVTTLLLVMFAARKKNWARQVLLILFVMGLPLFFGSFTSLLYLKQLVNQPIFLLTMLSGLTHGVLSAVGLYYIFSGPANQWYKPKVQTFDEQGNLVDEKSTVWTKVIPRTNMVSMVISLILVFTIDFAIGHPGSDLAMFWYIMLGVLSVFIFFFFLENYVLAKKFENTASNLDSSLAGLIMLRNFIFILNFIPFIQLLGLMLIVPFGIGLVVVYPILIHLRNKGTTKGITA